MKRIRTLKGRVLVKHRRPPERTESGLYLPLSAQERPQLGELVAKSDKSDLQPGSLVMFPKFSDRRLQLEGETYELLKETDLLLEVELAKGDNLCNSGALQNRPKSTDSKIRT